MTTYEKTGPTYSVGQELRTRDEETKKWIKGVVEEVSEGTVMIKWEDLSEPIEYRIDQVELQGDIFFD